MYSSVKSYFDLKKAQLNHLATLKIIGIPIEDYPQSSSKKGLFPVQIGCVCHNVQDSPENPCYCDTRPPIIVWIPEGQILTNYKSEQRNHDGRELTVFEVQREATIFVEKVIAVNLNSFSKKPIYNGNGNPSGPQNNVFKIPTTGNPEVDAVIAAGTAGWAVGTAIDEATGLSDWLAGVDNSPHWVKI
jgi:hypothetical protein